MTDYTEQEIKLARRIYDATQLVSGGMTIRRTKNIMTKLGYQFKDELPDLFYLETARQLLKHDEDFIKKVRREAIENM